MSAAAALEMKTDMNKITAGMKPTNKQLAAVLRCKFKLQKEVKRTASKCCWRSWRCAPPSGARSISSPPSKMLGTMRPDKRARRDVDADGGGGDDDDDDDDDDERGYASGERRCGKFFVANEQ